MSELDKLRETVEAVRKYSDFLLSEKARHLVNGVGIGLNLRLILQGDENAVLGD